MARMREEYLRMSEAANEGNADAAGADAGDGMTDDPDGVVALMQAAHNTLAKLMSIRQDQVTCMKQQALVEAKFTVFKSQVASTDNEIRMLRRAIRLIEQNPSVVGARPGRPGPDELTELRRNLANKEERTWSWWPCLRPGRTSCPRPTSRCRA